MARKNAMKNDSSSITFNSRTKAVMADVPQDNIKEKVSAVREVVAGKSNNEIVLVLQYYDYDVEKTIQAYVEDGAKSALTEWHYSGTKPVKKKRNKKKSAATQQLDVPQSPMSVSSESDSAGFMINGEARDHMLNGLADSDTDLTKPDKLLTNGSASPPTINASSSPPSLINNNNNNNIIDANLSASSYVIAAETVAAAPGNVKTAGTKEKSPSPLGQRQPPAHHRQRTHSGTPNEERGHGDTKAPQHTDKHRHNHKHHDKHHHDKHHHDYKHDHKHDHEDGRHRTTSTSSVGDGMGGKKNIHHVLERSSKDLHRQTVSLERLRLVFNEEVDKTYKRIKSVFDEIKHCLQAREDQLIREMDSVKATGRDTFIMRQGLAADLKVKIDRAEKMSDAELSELRNEIKHFVSDRKVDEDLGRTTRFLYDSDHLESEIRKFSEVIPVKCSYIQRRPSVSSVASSNPAEPDQQQEKNSLILSQASASEKKDDNSPGLPHMDSDQAHEMAELQRRLKQSLTLGGIAVETYPERPVSVPPPTNQSQQKSGRGRPASARDGYNRNRRRPDRRQDGPKDESRGGGGGGGGMYMQNSGGERVILIGKGTRQQGGSTRPPRGGRGRGGYGGRGRGGMNQTSRDNPSNENSAAAAGTNQDSVVSSSGGGGGRGASSSGAQERGNRNRRGNSSGSPRRGAPRSPGGGRGGGNRNSGPPRNAAVTPAGQENVQRSEQV